MGRYFEDTAPETRRAFVRQTCNLRSPRHPRGRLRGSQAVAEAPGFTKGQEPGARPQPQHLTVMPKDHTQRADL